MFSRSLICCYSSISEFVFPYALFYCSGRYSGLIVSVTDSDERTGFKPWSGALRCVVGQHTLLSLCLSPRRPWLLIMLFTVDNAIYWINHCSVDKCSQNKPHYHRIVIYPVDNLIHPLNNCVTVSLKLEMKVSLPGCNTRSRKHQANIG